MAGQASSMGRVIVSGDFGDVSSRWFRFLHEASRLGPVEVVLWSDDLAEALNGVRPRFSAEEREYVLGALRYVDRIRTEKVLASRDTLPAGVQGPLTWVVDQAGDNVAKRRFCAARGYGFHSVLDADLAGFPERAPDALDPDRKAVVVTGCYDWFHSGHVRFFEEVSEHGNLYVVVGHDANLRLLKGDGHPMFPEDERRYMVQSVRCVKQAFISTGHGWMDAEPEIDRLKPDAYVVNGDGDKPEKRAFCARHGLEYMVLKREPRPGLARRSSTDFRGF